MATPVKQGGSHRTNEHVRRAREKGLRPGFARPLAPGSSKGARPSVDTSRHAAPQGGWTIADVLLSLIFLGVLATVLQSFAIASLQSLRVRQVADDLEETARIAVEIMAGDIRELGYGLRGTDDRGLKAASSTRIQLARDLDLDGATSSSNERVGYEIDEVAHRLRRQLGGASPQPMVDNVDPGGTLFRFLDRDGAEIGAGTELDAAGRATVRQIEIDLRLSAPHPVRPSDRITARRHASVNLRNGQL